MAMPYTPQPFYLFGPGGGQPHWTDDVKPPLTEDDAASILDDNVLDSATPADMAALAAAAVRRPSVTKAEEDYAISPAIWHARPPNMIAPARHYSLSAAPLPGADGQPLFAPNGTAACGTAAYLPNQAWRSEANTPTPFFAPAQDPVGPPLHYAGAAVEFPAYAPHNPTSAVSMSPQSSQGGWASNTSSDAADQAHEIGPARFRPASPVLVLRSDGIRKKNAKFEIPKERNLATIDALIMQSTNEEEKKELKQQKRLLRNRQAALDSRQRKKTHTEKLEQEKKMFVSQKGELEDNITHLETALNQERDQWMHQRQQYEQYIQQLQFDRDEAIRTKTLETAELRRMNNILKDTIRDLERQHSARVPAATATAAASDSFANDFATFRSLDLGDNWEDEFSLISSDDLKMDDAEPAHRHATPRPTAPSTLLPAASQPAKAADAHADTGFSWNTFYMCLLSGAFIVSQAGAKPPVAASAAVAAALPSNMPALSEDYRAEAGNVLNAVLAAGPADAHRLLPSQATLSGENAGYPSVVDRGTDLTGGVPAHASGSSSLDQLHGALTAPSHHQQVAAAFSLSASSYNHIAHPDGVLGLDNDPAVDVKPTRLEQLFAELQAERDGIDKITGLSGKARQRSVLLDRVPEKVLRDFREMIGSVDET